MCLETDWETIHVGKPIPTETPNETAQAGKSTPAEKQKE